MNLLLPIVATSIVAGLLGCQLAPTSNYADTVLSDGKFYTSNSAAPSAEAIAIKGGIVVYVGDNWGAKEFIGPATDHHSLDQKLVLPGLVDSHTHPVSTTEVEPYLEIPATLDQKVILAAVAEYAKQNPDLKVIKGGYWAVDAFGPKGPNKAMLDEVVPDRPVILEDSSGHSQWLNSRALNVMGIDKNTADPVPGVSVFARNGEGEPTGWSKEAALHPFMEKLELPPSVNEDNLLKFLNYLSALGVTALFDAANQGDSAFAVLAKLDKEGTLPMRYFGTKAIRSPADLETVIGEFKRLRETYSGDRLRFKSIKLFLDGVSEVGTSFVLEPFIHEEGGTGLPTLSREQLDQLVVNLHEESIDLHVHAVGDAAVRLALDTVEAVQGRLGSLNTQVTLSHIELIDDADMGRFKELGVFANHTPHWNGGYFKGADVILGEERYSQMYRVQALFDDEAIVTFSSDITDGLEWVDGRGSPYYGMQVAHNRQDIEGGKDAPIRQPVSERLSLDRLIQGYTINGARQLRLADQVGSIEVGKSADLVVLEENIFEIDRYDIHKIIPQAVMMEGRLIHGGFPK